MLGVFALAFWLLTVIFLIVLYFYKRKGNLVLAMVYFALAMFVGIFALFSSALWLRSMI